MNLEDVENLDVGDLMDGALPSKKDLLQMLKDSNMTDEMKENLKSLLGGGRAPELFGTSSGGSYLGIVFILLIFAILREFKNLSDYYYTA